jgi:hypothetical protein
MINLKFDSKSFVKVLNNSVEYSKGFLEGIELSRLEFNRVLGGYTAEALGEYIDSKARMNPSSLHHVYEWNKVGSKDSRLFRINVNATRSQILFTGLLLDSKTSSPTTDQVFRNKAEVMESGISVTVSPKNSDFLVFEDDGETVFTTNTILISDPGGKDVAGSFSAVTSEFFNYYFTNSILYSFLNKLSNPIEFSNFFPSIKNSGRSTGVLAGRKYFKFVGGLS